MADAAKAKRDARRAERIAKIQAANSSAIRSVGRSRTAFRDVTHGNTPAVPAQKTAPAPSPSPTTVRAAPRTAPAVVTRTKKAPVPTPTPNRVNKPSPTALAMATPSASVADLFDALSSPEDDENAPATDPFRPPVSSDLAALQSPVLAPPAQFQQSDHSAPATVPSTPSIRAEMDALLSPDSATATPLAPEQSRDPPPPPDLTLLRKPTETSLDCSEPGASRGSTKRKSGEGISEIESAPPPSTAAENPQQDSTPVPPPRRAKRAKARPSSASVAPKREPSAESRTAAAALMALDIEHDDDAAPQLTVVLGRHKLKRSVEEEVELQRTLATKASEIAILLAAAENPVMSLEAAKSAVIEGLRLSALEQLAAGEDGGERGSLGGDVEVRDVQLSGMTIRSGSAEPGLECFGFLVYRRGIEVHASSLFRLGPHDEVEVPTTVVFQECDQDFAVTVELYGATVPMSADHAAEDELSTKPSGRKEKMKRAITKLRHDALSKIKSGAGRLHGIRMQTPTRGGATPAADSDAHHQPTEFQSVASLTVRKASIGERHLRVDYTLPEAELTGTVVAEVAAFSRSDCGSARGSETGYLSYFGCENPGSHGRWQRFYTQMDGTEMQLWRSERDAQWAVPPAKKYRLAGFSTNIQPLTRSVCARKHTIQLEYEQAPLRVACDSKAEVQRWSSKLATAIARAHAWDGAQEGSQ